MTRNYLPESTVANLAKLTSLIAVKQITATFPAKLVLLAALTRRCDEATTGLVMLSYKDVWISVATSRRFVPPAVAAAAELAC